jgi:hypothetical protein
LVVVGDPQKWGLALVAHILVAHVLVAHVLVAHVLVAHMTVIDPQNWAAL